MINSFNYKNILNELVRNDNSLRQITEEESIELKKCLYEMAVELDIRCKSNGIKLFLTGGTLLGAVRHHGFIPWDDDMDLGLSRNDYEKLKKIFDKEFGKDYELRCPNSDYPNGNRFMQIFKKGTILKTIGIENPFRPNSVYIDIFPYDYVPEGKIERRLKGIRSIILMLIASCVMDEKHMNDEYSTFLKKSKDGRLFLNMRKFIGKFFSFRSPEKWFDSVDSSLIYKKSGFLTSGAGRRYYFGETYSIDVFLPLIELEFEGHKFFAPGKFEVYLEGNYGKDYMIPPIKEKRESHFITELFIS